MNTAEANQEEDDNTALASVAVSLFLLMVTLTIEWPYGYYLVLRVGYQTRLIRQAILQ